MYRFFIAEIHYSTFLHIFSKMGSTRIYRQQAYVFPKIVFGPKLNSVNYSTGQRYHTVVQIIQRKLTTTTQATSEASLLPLSSKEYRPYRLIDKKKVNYNTNIYTFALPATYSLDIPVGKHLNVRAKFGNEYIVRPFTPITPHNTPGRVDLLMKTYPQGKMSQFMNSLRFGDTVELMGPVGLFKFTKEKYNAIGMIAGGTGITPMLQVIRYALSPESTLKDTKLVLLFANNTEDDIFFKEEFDILQREHPTKFSVRYVVANPPSTTTSKATYDVGFITEEIIRKYLPPPDVDNFLLICGPPPMEMSIAPQLKRLGYTSEMYFSFTVSQQPYIQGLESDVVSTAAWPPSPDKEYTFEEVRAHSTAQDLWLTINGNVYDVTSWVEQHPGGDIILEGAGVDATKLFEKEFPHSKEAHELLKKYYIGKLKK